MLTPSHSPERASKRRGEKRKASEQKSGPLRRIFHTSAQTSSNSISKQCPLCEGAHFLCKCFKFKTKSLHDRQAEVRRLQLCFNCLGQHRVNACTSSGRCSTCRNKHHTLLHRAPAPVIQLPKSPIAPSNSLQAQHDPTPKNVNVHTASVSFPKRRVVLATAQVGILGARGNQFRVRALLDQGSEASFISESMAQLLELPRKRSQISLSGLGGNASGTARTTTQVILQSLVDPSFQIETEVLVLLKLTSQLPARSIVELDLKQFSDLSLADPQFNMSNSVDLILGADVYGQLLRSGLKQFPPSHLVAQNTAFG